MNSILNEIENELVKAFKAAGYDEKYAFIKWSDRPDLCQFQCNGALAAAKEYKKAPFMIADEVVEKLSLVAAFKTVEMVKPGFINITLSDEYLLSHALKMCKDEKLGVNADENEKIIIDYGGANVAKPLHVGHLRSAVIGESIKRIKKYAGNDVTGDVHLGDWGLQIGLIITELKARKPELVYFDESFEGEYPEEAPFTMSDLEEIYPYANGYSKEHPEYKEQAQKATAELQSKKRGYLAIWKHIIEVSVADLKKIYDKLNVSFELWKKESDAQEYIPDMVEYMKSEGYAHIDQGALVVDVSEETDKKEIPPCMILKSDGATLYNTTDLATIVERRKLFDPDRIMYVVDKRQSLYFEQVFRCARKTKIIGDNVELDFLGFGTMNGKDGKPFKTRDGGVLRLEQLIKEVTDKVTEKMSDRGMDEETLKDAADKIALAAIKYGDLSNQASKDYVFDIDRFTSFEGNTGPYILYTIVRIKSLLRKAAAENVLPSDEEFKNFGSKEETDLLLSAAKWTDTFASASKENAPYKICQFIYELSENYNVFYHEHKILNNDNEEEKKAWINLSKFILKLLNTGIDLLGISAPEQM
ncbi:MAG: arginine--tRNA ligase [Lachnospiraceae bacterium]|nr:arginine--tRNA ligase [Lachnospiraceae bacterium]